MHPLLLELPEQIETERLILRPYRAGDGNWYYPMSLRNQAHLTRYERENPVNSIQTLEQAEIVVRTFAANWDARINFFLGAFEKQSGDFVGQIYIGPSNWDLPEFEVGYFADQAHEGQGYISEAIKGALAFIFRDLQAQRVRLECDDTNQRSFRVAERCGMLREGHIRQNKRNPDGSMSGTLWYGLLRSDYQG